MQPDDFNFGYKYESEISMDTGQYKEGLQRSGQALIPPAGAYVNTNTQQMVLSLLNLPMGMTTAFTGTRVTNTNTTMYLGLFNIPAPIIINTIYIDVTANTTAGTLDFTIYSEDGQVQHLALTTQSIGGTGATAITVSPSITLYAGNYYFAVNTNGTTDLTLRVYSFANIALNQVAGENIVSGTLAITAGTPPPTIDPTSITFTTTGTTQAFFVT